MANPLKELELSIKGFQFIQEIPINASPAKAWAAITSPAGWFSMSPEGKPAKSSLELTPGGRWLIETPEGASTLFATVNLVEPQKLLRVSGHCGLSHLPALSVVIFELQPQKDGKATLLRLGHRAFGYIDADLEKRYSGGWATFLPKIKALAEN